MGADRIIHTIEAADASGLDFERIGPDPVEIIHDFPTLRFKTTGLRYHESQTEHQAEFHENTAKFRAAQAAIGSGKSAMGTVEALRHSWYYRRNFGFIIRKTNPQMEISAIPDLLDLTPSWMIRSWSKQNKVLELLNQYGWDFMLKKGRFLKKKQAEAALDDIGGTSRIVFTSFEGTAEALNKWESSSIGWYMIDQAEWANAEIYGMLNHRMRRAPSQRRAWFLANFRKDIPVEMEWLWRLFSEDSTEYRKNHWYTSAMTTESNAQNTPADWSESLKDTMTEEEQARYLEGDINKMSMTLQVFDEFSREVHMIDHVEPPIHWAKGIGLDPGINNPTAFIEAAFSPAGDVYVYNEYEQNKRIISELATVLLLLKTPQHLYWFIDATGGNINQITGTSVLEEFRAYGLPFEQAPRSVPAGVLRIKEYLKVDHKHRNPFTGELGSPRLLISKKCPGLAEQLLLYRVDEPKTISLKNQTEKFRQLKDHRVDGLRFLLTGATNPIGYEKINQNAPPKHVTFPNGIPGAAIKQPDFIGIGDDGRARLDFTKIAAKSMIPVKKHTSPRTTKTTPWSEIQRNPL